MADAESGVRTFAAYLARVGLKHTRQRERIVRTFFAAGRHIGAEELYHRVRADEPTVGLVTVYRTLKLLRAAGLATERSFGNTYTSFDPTPADRAHHLICTRCGAIREFDDATLRARAAVAARRHGFTVTDQRLEIYGVCKECAELAGRRRARSARPLRSSARGEARA